MHPVRVCYPRTQYVRAPCPLYPPGVKETEAQNHLEKKLKASPQLSFAEAVQAAIAALQAVLSEDFKASEIEARSTTQTQRGTTTNSLPGALRAVRAGGHRAEGALCQRFGGAFGC